MAVGSARLRPALYGLGVLACAGTPDGGGREALLAADRAAGGSLPAVLAEDAYYLTPDKPLLQGREAIARALGDPREGRVERTPLVAALSSDGSHGYTAGRLLGRGLAAGETVHAKYLAYWRHDGGRWRVWAYVENPSPAAPDVVPPAAESSHGSRSRATGGDPAGPDQLLAADAEFSRRSATVGAGPAFGEFAEPGALLLRGAGGAMLWGDTAIAGFIGGAIPTTDRLTWTPRVAHLAPGGDLGFTVGDAVYRHLPAAGGAELSYTKYLTVWRRQPDGRWRYAADGGNDAPAPAGSGDLAVEPVAGALRLANPDTAPAFFTAFEQGTTALVNWRPCVDLAACRRVAPGTELTLPLDSIGGWTPAAESVVVFWWRRRPRAEGWSFDSVRSLTVGARAGGG
jgi:ketosteroid isomerase-like protein